MREALFYEKLAGDRVRCTLCSHFCSIGEGRPGVCGVRVNHGGQLYTLVHDRVVSREIDPIEKKPLFHFYPGARAYSVATVGCNFRCFFCQNYEIAQYPKRAHRHKAEVLWGDLQPIRSRFEGGIPGEKVTPEQIVQAAKASGCEVIAYTYTEPTVFFELAYDTARCATKEGLKNVFVTNGYIGAEALLTIRPYLHAANIDLKGFTDEFYKKICGARLQPVLDSIRRYKELGIWIEVTTLVIPGCNDSDRELRQIAQFLKSVGDDIPWHISQFYPAYKMVDTPRTPVSTLRKARKIGLDVGLRYVYLGNVPGEVGESSYCYQCERVLISRYGLSVLESYMEDSQCPDCGARIDGVGLAGRDPAERKQALPEWT
ncbi:MAG: AmmeMemoRadiSam system radical SAM enzyme [Acidobacteria bacterium]|nr:AmmeMemoRadiSam system radical SAM enzyme [Acidobacteriota bacterium]